MYFFLVITLALTLLLIFNTAASVLATALWNILAALNFSFKQKAKQKSVMILALRLIPTGAAFVFIAAFLLPAYFLFEPNKSGETVSIKLIVLASISILSIISAFYRVWLTSQATHRLLQNWLQNAQPMTVKGVSIPVYSISHPFPVIAVVGAMRPRMFIASQIYDSLEAAEIQAAIAHEEGHLISRDNLKRALMRFCRDLLLMPHGRELERAWAESAEVAADEYAVRKGGKTMALNLASALIKIARIAPKGLTPAMPAGAFLIAKQNCDVSERVCNLIRLTETENLCQEPLQLFGSGTNLWLYSSLILGVIFILATHQGLLLTVHEMLEIVVRLLK